MIVLLVQFQNISQIDCTHKKLKQLTTSRQTSNLVTRLGRVLPELVYRFGDMVREHMKLYF